MLEKNSPNPKNPQTKNKPTQQQQQKKNMTKPLATKLYVTSNIELQFHGT